MTFLFRRLHKIIRNVHQQGPAMTNRYDFYFACSRVTPLQTPYKENAQKCSHYINPTYFISHIHNLLPMFTCYQKPNHARVTLLVQYMYGQGYYITTLGQGYCEY